MANYTYNFATKNTDFTVKTVETENTLRAFADFDSFRVDKNGEEEALKASEKAFRLLSETHASIDGEEAFKYANKADTCKADAKECRKAVADERKRLVSLFAGGIDTDNYIDMAARILANMGYIPGENTALKLCGKIGVKPSNNKAFYQTGKQTANVSKSKARELLVMAIHDCIIEALPEARINKVWKFHPEKWDK